MSDQSRAAVRDIDAAQFESAVLERSREVPVLVDFWAPWCAPCRTLGPVLEAVVAERDGEVELVKIDTDANQELAARYQVRGIPAVKAFVDGRVVDEFVGAQDRRAVQDFVERLVPPPEARALGEAAAELAAKRYERADELLGPLVQVAAYHDRAQLLLARGRAERGDMEGARECLAAIDEGSPLAGQATALGSRLELSAAAATLTDELDAAVERLEAAPDDHALRFAVAGKLADAGRTADALEQLLELVRRSRTFGDDAGRRAMLAIFEGEGPNSDLARDFRRQLQIIL